MTLSHIHEFFACYGMGAVIALAIASIPVAALADIWATINHKKEE